MFKLRCILFIVCKQVIYAYLNIFKIFGLLQFMKHKYSSISLFFPAFFLSFFIGLLLWFAILGI